MIPHQKLNTSVLSLASALFIPYDAKAIKRYIPQRNIAWTGSARHAIKSCLLPKMKVGLPAYTCHVVLDAITDAKAIPVFIDSGLIADAEEINKHIKEIDALILPHNFGFMSDMKKIKSLCRQHNVSLIEDCSQSLGATYDEEMAGSYGDFSVYSFGISKNIGFVGGMLASDKDIILKPMPRYPPLKLLSVMSKVILAKPLFNPLLYSAWNSFLKYDTPRDNLSYAMSDYGKFVVQSMMRKYTKALELRRKNANICMQKLDLVVDFVKPLPKNGPAWLYFTFTHPHRDEFAELLHQEGVQVMPLHTFKDLSDGKCRQANTFQNNNLTFALHRPTKEIEIIIEKIKKVSDML